LAHVLLPVRLDEMSSSPPISGLKRISAVSNAANARCAKSVPTMTVVADRLPGIRMLAVSRPMTGSAWPAVKTSAPWPEPTATRTRVSVVPRTNVALLVATAARTKSGCATSTRTAKLEPSADKESDAGATRIRAAELELAAAKTRGSALASSRLADEVAALAASTSAPVAEICNVAVETAVAPRTRSAGPVSSSEAVAEADPESTSRDVAVMAHVLVEVAAALRESSARAVRAIVPVALLVAASTRPADPARESVPDAAPLAVRTSSRADASDRLAEPAAALDRTIAVGAVIARAEPDAPAPDSNNSDGAVSDSVALLAAAAASVTWNAAVSPAEPVATELAGLSASPVAAVMSNDGDAVAALCSWSRGAEVMVRLGIAVATAVRDRYAGPLSCRTPVPVAAAESTSGASVRTTAVPEPAADPAPRTK